VAIDFNDKIYILDGAMGTMLQRAGMAPDETTTQFGLEHPQIWKDIHSQYIDAGADIIYASTFGMNRFKTEELDRPLHEAVALAMKAACEARDEAGDKGRAVKVALGIGPLGELLEPMGTLKFEEAYEAFTDLVTAGKDNGADLVVIETMTDLYEVKAAVLAVKENSGLPVMVSMTFEDNGRTFTGVSLEAMAMTLEGLGVDAIGINCSLGPVEILPMAKELRELTSVAVFAKPNAGLPDPETGKYDITCGQFIETMKEYMQAGINMVGGCCGTTPEYIAGLAECRDELAKNGVPGAAGKEGHATGKEKRGLRICSGTDVVHVDHVTVIGERINPTGKKRLKQALLDGDMDYILNQAVEQIDAGAEILDVNVGVPGINEAAAAEKTVLALQAVTSAPLQIDTSDYETMERALRLYNGKPLLNSVSGKDESLAKVLPLVKKYGAVVVGLALDDDGIPATAAGRLAVAEKIIARAAECGIEKRNIIIDPLALTISTGPDNAAVDLEVIRKLTEQKIKTIMGVSNISFGLPSRDAVNSTFFTLAMEAGLSCAIINPQSKAMLDAYYAYRALKGLDGGCKAYVKRFADSVNKVPTAAVSEYTLHDAIVKGLQEQSRLAVTRLLETEKPLDIINTQMIPALDFVGNGFEKKNLFLPQLLMSADAAKAAFEVIRDRMADGGAVEKGTAVVIATVKGDIHDIGKNIVKVLLENYGYNVIDLGKDVAVEAIVKAVLEHKAHVVGLSALMTTTVGAMAATIKALRDVCNCRIVVGGAVLTQDYTDSIGADHYAPNAVSAVGYVNEVVEK